MRNILDCTRRAGHARALLALLFVAGTAGAQVQQSHAPNEVRVGDRIFLWVQGEKALQDSFTVITGPTVELPVLGAIQLSGVQRQDLESYFTKEIGRFIRNPVVRVRSSTMIRVGVVGDVARPGFIMIASSAPLSDALNSAGGLTPTAFVDKIVVSRGGKPFIRQDSVKVALSRGTSLDELGVEPGDQVIVPRRNDSDRTTRIVGIVLALPAAIYGIIALRHK